MSNENASHRESILIFNSSNLKTNNVCLFSYVLSEAYRPTQLVHCIELGLANIKSIPRMESRLR